MPNFIQIYGNETASTEKFVDIIVENGNLYRRYYSKINNISRDKINELISKIVINDDFIIDKVSKDRIELVDSKTGKIRYYIWNHNCVEKYFLEDLKESINNNYLLE